MSISGGPGNSVTEAELFDYCIDTKIFNDPTRGQGLQRAGDTEEEFCRRYAADENPPADYKYSPRQHTSWFWGLLESITGIPEIEAALESLFDIPVISGVLSAFGLPPLSGCIHELVDYLEGDGPKPSTACLVEVGGITLLAVVVAVVVLGLLLDLVGFSVPVLGQGLTLIRFLLEEALRAVREGVQLSLRLVGVAWTWFVDLCGYLSRHVGGSEKAWLAAGLSMAVFVALQVVIKAKGFASAWENGRMHSIYDFVDYPMRAFRDWTGGFGWVFGLLGSLFTFPLDCGAFFLSLVLGALAYPFQVLVETLRDKNKKTPVSNSR